MYFKERFNLSKYGDEYKDSFVILKLATPGESMKQKKKLSKIGNAIKIDETGNDDEIFNETNKIFETETQYVKKFFDSGMVYDNEETRVMKKDDLNFFPRKIISELTDIIDGGLGK